MLQESSGENLNLLMDEVIGVSGKLSRQGNVLFVNSPIIRPHLGRYREVSRSEEPYIALFISDVHLGSGTFQNKEWDKFISWLNGDVDYHKEWIPSPGYLIIAGDAVDGIDSYPGQEADLSITGRSGNNMQNCQSQLTEFLWMFKRSLCLGIMMLLG